MKALITLYLATAIGLVSHATELATIANQHLTVTISSFGAELQSVKSNKNGREYLWQGDPEHWSGRAPIMFPVIVRFKDDEFTHKGKRYKMPLLGLGPNFEYRIIEKAKDRISFRLESNHETSKLYPFAFEFEVTYRLEGKRLVNHFTVENLGSETMPFTLGGHPGFVLPNTDGKTREDYALTFSKTQDTDRPIVTDGLIQKKRVPFLSNESRLPIADPRVPNHGMLLLEHGCERIGVAEKGGPAFVEIEFGDFPNVNIWTPPGKPFVCIEPLIGHHDLQKTPKEISRKTYLSRLSPGETRSYQFSILTR